MAWAHAEYMAEATVSARIAELDLHIAEVSAAIAADISSDGKSRSSQGLITYRRDLFETRRELASMPDATGVGVSGGPTVSRIAFRPIS